MAADDFKTAIEFARINGSISVSNLASKQRLGIRFARAIIAEMVAQGAVESADSAGRHRYIGTGPAPEEKSAEFPDVAKTDAERIYDLEAQVSRLKSAGRVLIGQRESWKLRAEAAEANLVSRSESFSSKSDHKFKQLKRFIAIEIHPDKVQDQFSKSIREVVFKVIWSKIEDIEGQA